MPVSKYFEIRWAKEAKGHEPMMELHLNQSTQREPVLYLSKEELEDLKELIFRTKIEFFSEP